jgi:hypothetical protein
MTPKEMGFYMPAEWHRHSATWLTYPHNEDSWPGKIETIFPSYHLFVKTLAETEQKPAHGERNPTRGRRVRHAGERPERQRHREAQLHANAIQDRATEGVAEPISGEE